MRILSKIPIHRSEPPEQEEFDFETINTVAEAGQMPLLEPAFQLALSEGIKASKENPKALVSLRLDQSIGSHSISTLFCINFSNGSCPITMKGDVNGQPFKGKIIRSPHLPGAYGAAWNSSFGNNQECLLIEANAKMTSFTVRGSIGTIGTDLTLSQCTQGSGGIITDGTLGYEHSYYSVSRISSNKRNGKRSLVSHGSVDGLMTSKNYRIREIPSRGHCLTIISGCGYNFGQQQEIRAALLVKKQT